MKHFTGSAAGLQAWVQVCGVEGHWDNENEFISREGAKLVWTPKTGTLQYSGEKKAVKNLKAALEGKQTSKGLKIFLWLAVSVGFALMPLAASYINGRSSGKPPDWIDLLSGGELFLIAAALTADGIGRAFLGGKRFQSFRISCGIGCALLLAATSLYFGRIAFSSEEQRTVLISAVQAKDLSLARQALEHPGVDRQITSKDSLWLFVFAIAASFGIILVEEET
jgi:hypothetical protein